MFLKNKFQFQRYTFLVVLVIFFSACEKRIIPDPVELPPLSYNDTIHNIYKDITTDTVLKNLGGNGIDYRIMNMVRVLNGATLTIDAGVNLQVVQNGGLYISNGSALQINGTAVAGVSITGQSKSKGFWNGIVFENTVNVNNQLRYTTIEYAGGDAGNVYKSAAISLFASAVSFNNCTIKNNKFFGFAFDSTSTPDMHNCNITANDSMPVLMMHNNFGLLTADNNYLLNKDDRILVKSTQGVPSSKPQIIKKIGVPYYLAGTSNFGNALTLEAGVRFVMGKLAALYFNNSISNAANFSAIGTSNNQIIIEGAKPDSGYWQGIVIHGGGITNLNYCQLKYAGTAADFGYPNSGASLMLSGGTPGVLNVTNCTIQSAFFNGIIIKVPDILYNTDIETSNTFIQVSGINVIYY